MEASSTKHDGEGLWLHLLPLPRLTLGQMGQCGITHSFLGFCKSHDFWRQKSCQLIFRTCGGHCLFQVFYFLQILPQFFHLPHEFTGFWRCGWFFQNLWGLRKIFHHFWMCWNFFHCFLGVLWGPFQMCWNSMLERRLGTLPHHLHSCLDVLHDLGLPKLLVLLQLLEEVLLLGIVFDFLVIQSFGNFLLVCH